MRQSPCLFVLLAALPFLFACLPITARAPLSADAELADWRHTALAQPDGIPWPSSRAGTPITGDGVVTGPTELGEDPLFADTPSETALFTLEAVDTPLSALLLAIARDARLQLHLHQPLPDPITIRLVDVPLEAVLDGLTHQVEMHWQLDGQALEVWGNQPFHQSHAIDYLNIDRTTQGSVGLATRVGTINATAGEGGAGNANNSDTLIENLSQHRFWQSLQADMAGLVGEDDKRTRYTINRDAGLLSVVAGARVQRRVRDYVQQLNRSAGRQVLIEATVLEVALSDRFEAGIDWQLLADGVNGLSAAQVLSGAARVASDTVDRLTAPSGLFTLVQDSRHGSMTATVSLLEQFGDVRILSRPRIIALNNQSSVLKVVDNRVYFTVSVERQRGDDIDDVLTETQIHTVPVGLVMNVTPHVSQQSVVMLNVRPTLSRILGFVDDPNPELAQANVRNGVPEIQVREMESMLRVQSGRLAIIGGLMQNSVEERDQQLPGLGDIPLLGSLFSQRRRQHQVTELLVVLRPTVLPPGGVLPSTVSGFSGNHPF